MFVFVFFVFFFYCCSISKRMMCFIRKRNAVVKKNNKNRLYYDMNNFLVFKKVPITSSYGSTVISSKLKQNLIF